jgi:hypothetical protein
VGIPKINHKLYMLNKLNTYKSNKYTYLIKMVLELE